jgi:hypothetical protein
LIGNLRHHIAHHYCDRLLGQSDHLPAFRAMFGDDAPTTRCAGAALCHSGGRVGRAPLRHPATPRPTPPGRTGRRPSPFIRRSDRSCIDGSRWPAPSTTSQTRRAARRIPTTIDQRREQLMADKSPRQHQSKKSGKTLKEKRSEKKAKQVSKRPSS